MLAIVQAKRKKISDMQERDKLSIWSSNFRHHNKLQFTGLQVAPAIAESVPSKCLHKTAAGQPQSKLK